MRQTIFLIIFTIVGILLPLRTGAYSISQLEVAEANDFMLGPGKAQFQLSPGEEVSQVLYITNRFGEARNFRVDIEDFISSDDPETEIELLGNKESAFSLKNYLEPEVREFTLAHGERIILPVKISIPENAGPGGLYGSVLVSTSSVQDADGFQAEAVSGQMKLITRLGSLFFVRVKGEVLEEGSLEAFKMGIPDKTLYDKGPIVFQLLYRNQGNVHLIPYGSIAVKNIFGKKVDDIEIDPWFAMPGSLRSREVAWNKEVLFGRYTAAVSINRGYGDIVDERSIVFWVIPWKRVIAVLAALIVMVGFLIWVKRRVNISLKISMKSVSIIIIIVVFGVGVYNLRAAEMESGNYKVESSSINVGGRGSASAQYKMRETIGEVGTGLSRSANYQLNAGYQQMQVTFISISEPANVSMSPAISSRSGGVASGSAAWTIITDNTAGYAVTIAASTLPALTSGSSSFADYTPAFASTPDYNWQIDTTNSEFGFTVEGTDTVQLFQDNGVNRCGQGSNETVNRCWYSLSPSDLTIASSGWSNHPGGSVTTVKFMSESGSVNIQTAGIYTANITITATTL